MGDLNRSGHVVDFGEFFGSVSFDKQRKTVGVEEQVMSKGKYPSICFDGL